MKYVLNANSNEWMIDEVNKIAYWNKVDLLTFLTLLFTVVDGN